MAFFAKPAVNERTNMNIKIDPASTEQALSVIAAGMKLTGDIETNGIVKIEGRIDGTVRGARQLLLGRMGEIHGDVYAREVVIAGTIVGTVVAEERIEVQEASQVKGDLYTKSIVVLEGATLNGSVKMDESVRDIPGAPTPLPRPEPLAQLRGPDAS